MSHSIIQVHQQEQERTYSQVVKFPPAGARLPLEVGPAMSTAGSCLAESGAFELSGLLLSKQSEDGSQDGR